jgi:ATP-dependent RNA helicase DeaD
MNGDMAQNQREQMIDRFKRGSLDILVATDVAARGLDVDRISHVVNFDIPYDTEAYIHRIGRTGRAGRLGNAILFVAPRERRMLGAIERATRQKIEALELPSTEIVNNKRIANFKQKISDTLAAGELAFMQNLVEQYQQEHDVPAIEIAAALATMSIGDQPLLMKPEKAKPARTSALDKPRPGQGNKRPGRLRGGPDKGSERFRIEVGSVHGVKPGNIVGAIANEAGIDGQLIGHIEIEESFSMVDLPIGMPNEVFRDLKKVWVCGQSLKISRVEKSPSDNSEKRRSSTDKKRKRETKPVGKGRAKGKGKGETKSKPKSAANNKPSAESRPKPKLHLAKKRKEKPSNTHNKADGRNKKQARA